MANNKHNSAKSRVAFLLLLAIGITALFFWLTKGFVLAVFMAAALAGVAHPLYRRLVDLLRGRKVIASAATVAFSLLLVIIPLLLFLMVLIAQAVEISESATDWVTSQAQQAEGLRQQIKEDPTLKRLLPYQDEIFAKAGQLATKAGSFVAQGLVAGAMGTAEFFLTLFIMLYAMFCFLKDGPAILDWTFGCLPLSAGDRERLVASFNSVSRATLKGTLVIGIVQGGLAGISFWVVGIEGVVFWSVVMAVLSIIPGVGSALVWVPAVILLAVNGQIGAAVGVGLWCGIVVGTADNVLRPLLIGKDTKMPDLLVLLTTLGGLTLFGAAGIVIGPVIGALFLAIWELWGAATKDTRALQTH